MTRPSAPGTSGLAGTLGTVGAVGAVGSAGLSVALLQPLSEEKQTSIATGMDLGTEVDPLYNLDQIH